MKLLTVLQHKSFVLFYALMLTTFVTACSEKPDPIPQAELVGIWKLNGYNSTTYKIEITQDGYLYWWNYSDQLNRVEEFEMQYNPDRNMIKLYRPGKKWVVHHIYVRRHRHNGHLILEVPHTGFTGDDTSIASTVEYYKMN
ncbi:MAG: hypothetical protein NZM35_03660 [Chitinophagales bacterium]|nr:hypothetical protein [Chitinophagales bacterium]MDW8418383.1 hypothetical protein [Chitinophagales bacterium]